MRLLAHDPAILPRYTVFRLAAALGLVVAFIPVHTATAQDPYPDLDDIGLVMTIHTQTVEPRLDEHTAKAVGPELYQGTKVVAGLILRLGGQDDMDSFIDAIDEMVPDSSSMDYTIYAKDQRMRVDMGNSSLLARLDSTGSVLEYGVLDPESGQLVRSDLYDEAVRLGSSAPYDATVGGDGDVRVFGDQEPIRTDEFAQIAGHTARRYDFTQNLVIAPFGADEVPYPTIHVERSIRVWIAESGPYVNDPDASAVSREFARSLPPELVRLSARGLLLGADDESAIGVALWTESEHATPAGGAALEASSSFRVTHLSREVVDDALLAGFEQERQACDCSCAAFEQLKELSEGDPNAMGKAMCAQQCMSKWVPACIDMSGGD